MSFLATPKLLGNIKTSLLLLLLSTLIACASTTSNESILDQAREAYYDEDYPLARQKFNHYLQNQPDRWLAYEAHYHLALLQITGLGGEQNLKQAVAHLEQAAGWYADRAKLILAKFYQRGIGVDKDIERAISLYQDVDTKQAKLYLSVLYLRDKEKEDEQSKAKVNALVEAVVASAEQDDDLKYWYESDFDGLCDNAGEQLNILDSSLCFSTYKLETLEHAQSLWEQRELSDTEYAGELLVYLTVTLAQSGGRENIAFYYWAATQGDSYSQYLLGNTYLNNEKQQQAIEWYTKAAEQGNAEAAYTLANLGIEQAEQSGDFKAVLHWLTLAAKAGHNEATINLADYYLNIEKDFEQSLMWLQLGAHRGDPIAKHRLADAYFNSAYNMQEKQPIAMQMYEDLFFKEDDKKAAYHLGITYANGSDFVARDFEQSRYWLRKAAIADYLPAKIALAFFLSDQSEGLRWRQEVVQLDTSEMSKSQRSDINLLRHQQVDYCLSLATPDSAQAIKLLSLAANDGDIPAHAQLGLLYYQGNETLKADPEQAFHWLAKWKQKVDYLIENDPLEYAVNEDEYDNQEAEKAYQDLRYLELLL